MSNSGNNVVIFMDSHPEEQSGYFKSLFLSIRAILTSAVTGVVERFQQPGSLRLKWYTHDGNEGIKDYPLNEYEQVRNDYHEVLKLSEVRRAMVLGYPAQNPYILVNDKNPWIDLFKREKIQREKMAQEQRLSEARVGAQTEGTLDINSLVRETEREEGMRIQKNKEAENKKLEEARSKRQGNSRERFADEEEGILSVPARQKK